MNINPEMAEAVANTPKRNKFGHKVKGELNRKTKTALDLIATAGVDPKTAYILASNGRTPSSASLSRLTQKVEKYSLQTASMQKLASSVVKDCLKGKEATYTVQKAVAGVGIVDMEEKIIPTWTNKLAAAAMVQDRVDPAVKRNENLNVNVDMHPVDLSKYLG